VPVELLFDTGLRRPVFWSAKTPAPFHHRGHASLELRPLPNLGVPVIVVLGHEPLRCR